MDRDRDRFGGRRDDRRGGGMGVKPNYFLPKPVKVGDVLDVTVEAVASKGDGIAKKDGFVIFVKDAKQGETVNVRITDVKARFAIGELTGAVASEASASAASAPAADEPSEGSESTEEEGS